jgi:hypothetical protein
MRAVEPAAVDHGPAHTPEVADGGERVGIEQREVGPVTDRDHSDLALLAEELRRVGRRGLKRCECRDAGLGNRLHFTNHRIARGQEWRR